MVENKKLVLSAASVKSLYKILFKYYGPQGWWPIRSRRICAGASLSETLGFNSSGYHPGQVHQPDASDSFEIAAGAVLTQNTNWKNASAAIDGLIAHGLLTPEKILETDLTILGRIIRPSGYYNQKAIKLKAVSELFVNKNGGTPERDELLSAWGIGPETADAIMLYGFNKPYFVIDAYTRRILSRYTGINDINFINYEDLRTAVECVFPEDLSSMQEYHALLVHHAKKHCSATANCNGCPVAGMCKKIK